MVTKLGAKDGLCVHADKVIRGLAQRGHLLHVFTQSKSRCSLRVNGIHRFRAFQLNPHFSVDAIDAPRTIARVCQDEQIDVLHVQMNSGTTEFLLPLFKARLPPLVVTYHLAYSSDGSSMKSIFDILSEFSILASKRYDAIILVHPFQKTVFSGKQIPEEKIHVVPNGVDTDVFKPRQREEDGFVNFIDVGRLSYDKGVHMTIQAFRKYHKENPRTRLMLVGDGMLKSMLHDRRNSDSIYWYGGVEHDRVARFLQEADIFVIPMAIGPITSSLSVLEAMSCGLPIIATDIADAGRLIRPHEGILTQPGRLDEIVDAMRLLAEDETLRKSMGQACRERVVRDYSWNRQIEQTERVYMSLLGSS
ncbi:MAG: glycosyltransferase family 4 protein [Candidatus Thorarchaeota archaeon]